MMTNTEDYSIQDLQSRYNLSIRAYHVCLAMKFKTLNDIVKYYQKNKNFNKIRNCGRRTNEELSDLVQNFNPNSFEIAINSCFKKLSNRGRNAIVKYLNTSKLTKSIIEEYFINEDFGSLKIRNIGIRTEKEIKLFSLEICNTP